MQPDDEPAEQTEAVLSPAETAPQKAELYPEHLGSIVAELPGEADAFDVLREQLLLGYGYQTARAYWGDLEHWRDWCLAQTPAIDPLAATSANIQDYLAWLQELDYSPNTRARRLTTLRAFYEQLDQPANPTTSVPPVRRRKLGKSS